jgi:iron complex outermembrane receptor protein
MIHSKFLNNLTVITGNLMQYIYQKSLVALAISVVLAPSLYAKEVAPNNEKEQTAIEEVTVVAKKTSLANNIVDQPMIQQQSSVSSVLAVMDNLPGISINEGDAFGGDDWSTSITMRGFSIDGNQQQLGMTVDGIPNGGSNYGGGAKANRYLDSENMATVEVTQGSSDLSSASLEALGGTFNFVSSDPLQEAGTTFAITNGDHNAKRYYVKQEFGEFNNNTRAYVSYSSTSNNRWIGTGSNGGADRQHGAFKFISDFGALQLVGRLSFDDVAEDNYNSVSLEQFKQTPDWDQLTWNWTGIPHYDQMFAEGWSTLRKNTLGYLKLSYDISATSSFEITPYIHKNTGRGDWIPPYLVNAVDDNGNITSEGGTITQKYGFTDTLGNPLSPDASCTESLSWPWQSGPALNPACYASNAMPVMSYRHTHYQKDRVGMTSNYNLSLGMHDIKAGLWLENNIRKEHRDWHKVINAKVSLVFDDTPYWTQYSNKFTTNVAKWYAQDTVTIDQLTLNAGVQKYLVDIEKYNEFSKSVTGKVTSNSKILFSAGAQYQFNDYLEFFTGYSDNFSAIKDGVLERDASSLTEIKPETARNIDLGLRYNDEKFNFSATTYDIKFDNRITFIAPGSDTAGIDFTIGTNGTYINVGGIKSKGFELSANYKFTNQWSIYSSYTNNKSTYVGNAPGFNAGDKVIDSVDNMFVLSTDYYSGDLSFGTSAKYTSARGKAPSYTVIDANVGYDIQLSNPMIKSLNIAFVVNNLLDKRYLSTGTGTGSTYFIGGPRTAALTVTANF